MGLADDFQQVLDSLPDDWTDIVCDLRLGDEDLYVDAAVLMTQINAQPYSEAEWHFPGSTSPTRSATPLRRRRSRGHWPYSTSRGSRAS